MLIKNNSETVKAILYIFYLLFVVSEIIQATWVFYNNMTFTSLQFWVNINKSELKMSFSIFVSNTIYICSVKGRRDKNIFLSHGGDQKVCSLTESSTMMLSY